MNLGTFPFGQPVRKVLQKDRSPKKVFVLGVYASAVHAKWIDPTGKVLVKAMAVASEPEIFWRGDGADEIISRIKIPLDAGKLEPADRKFNGPSGIALDERILKPLGFERKDAWLCDLVPYSCCNSGQKAAIEREYNPRLKRFNLPEAKTPQLPTTLADKARQDEILAELIESRSKILVLLGDEPIRWFLNRFVPHRSRLSHFVEERGGYGRRYPVSFGGREIEVLPLAHPRQIARLGKSSEKWFEMHERWIRKEAGVRKN